MSRKIIEIIVTPKGEATIQTKGYAGSDCQQASKFLVDALGIVITERTTSEFYETAVSDQQVTQQPQ
jgi:hypothetical protein